MKFDVDVSVEFETIFGHPLVALVRSALSGCEVPSGGQIVARLSSVGEPSVKFEMAFIDHPHLSTGDSGRFIWDDGERVGFLLTSDNRELRGFCHHDASG